MSETQASDGGSDQAPHRRGEGRDPQLARDGPGLSVQPRLDLLEVGQEPRSGIDEVAAVSGEHHPATDAFEQGTPACFSSRFTCWEIALGVKPSASAAFTTDPWLSTARREISALRSIMKQCYMIACMIIRWRFIVSNPRMDP